MIKMTDKSLEKNLRGFDFSEFSKVKKSLFNEILFEHRKDNFRRLGNLSDEIMTEEELDYIAAAGNTATNLDDTEIKKI